MADTRYYFDFNFPMPIVDLIMSVLGGGKSANTPVIKPVETANREWFSQTRTSVDTTTEVVTTNFRLPLSVSELTLEILRMPCLVEVWYQDRSNNWRPVLDGRRSPLKITVAKSSAKSWFKWATRCYPIVAKKLQFRITRAPDPDLKTIPYPVGLRNCLIRRNVYDRAQGGAFEDYVDVMGNVISRYVRDWDSTKAVDNNYTTFWKSEPQPDPAAVVSLFLDVRTPEGGPKVVDKVFVDPVYSGQHLNLYYSNDDTVGVRALSPVTISPSGVQDMQWQPNEGLRDTVIDPSDSYYRFPLNVGPQRSQASWIGAEWSPGFGSSTGNLAQNVILFGVNANADGQWRPTLYYDSGAKSFALEFFDGTSSIVYSTFPVATDWIAREPVRIIAGWSYGPDRVRIKVVNAAGTVLTELDATPSNLPARVSFDGTAGVSNVRGTLTNLVVKLDDIAKDETRFLANPTYYCDPDPVVRDENGKLPPTSLDAAIYVAPWITREHGSGGSDESHFADKKWTPIWRDYVAYRGFLHLPAPTSMKYLKLEFTNLTEEPYPIYESGIEVRYKVFPISVMQQSSIGPRLYTGEGGFLGLGTFISMNGVKSVNWLNPFSVMQAVGAMVTPQTQTTVITTGTPYVTTTLPNSGAQLVEDSRRIEAGNTYVYSRDTLQPYILASDQYNTIIKAEGLQAIQPYVDVPWDDIEKANPGAVTKVKSTGTVPIRGTDWWIYPGQQLKVPASVMQKITDTSTVTERKFTLEHRVRFNTTQVHRYEYRTVKRDAAIAYFAGVREVQTYTSSYIAGEDKPVYDFPIYDPDQWTFDPHIVPVTETADDGTTTAGISLNPLGPIKSGLPIPASAFKTITTQSDFTRLKLNYRDSTPLRSNSLWATPDDEAGEGLSPYVSLTPTTIPSGYWADVSASWFDPDTKWGSSYGVISSTLNDERRFQGTRMLSFNREADISLAVENGVEAGISLEQHVNFLPLGLARVGVVFYKPFANKNKIRLRLTRASDNAVLLTDTIKPQIGSWVEHTTPFVELPETLANGGFSTGDLTGWTPDGPATWTQDNTVGRTVVDGTPGSAKVISTGGVQTLQTELMRVYSGNTISCGAWIKWDGLSATDDTAPAIWVEALFYQSTYDEDGLLLSQDLHSTHVLPDAVLSGLAASGGWLPVGGEIFVPANQGITEVAFRIVVDDVIESGTVWVDDVLCNVPGSIRQTFNLALTVIGNDKDTLYVSDLYSEITPVRHFVQLGPTGSPIYDVTDLSYTQNQAIVTAPVPVNEMSLRTVLLTPKRAAFGCTATPLYRK